MTLKTHYSLYVHSSFVASVPQAQLLDTYTHSGVVVQKEDFKKVW